MADYYYYYYIDVWMAGPAVWPAGRAFQPCHGMQCDAMPSHVAATVSYAAIQYGLGHVHMQ